MHVFCILGDLLVKLFSLEKPKFLADRRSQLQCNWLLHASIFLLLFCGFIIGLLCNQKTPFIFILDMELVVHFKIQVKRSEFLQGLLNVGSDNLKKWVV